MNIIIKMSKNNIKIPKDYSDKEIEEPTYNNFDSIQGLLNDVKSENQVDREESVGDDVQQALEESDVEINKKKRKGKLRKILNSQMIKNQNKKLIIIYPKKRKKVIFLQSLLKRKEADLAEVKKEKARKEKEWGESTST